MANLPSYSYATNLMTEYKDRIEERYKQKSLTDQHAGKDFDWAGKNSIITYEVERLGSSTYAPEAANFRFNNGNAYTNVKDTTHTYTLSQHISLGRIIEQLSNMDKKNILKAQHVMKQWVDEDVVPTIDEYRIKTWMAGAGGIATLDAGESTLDYQNIARKILQAKAWLHNHAVSHEGAVVFVGETLAVEADLAAQLAYNQEYTKKGIVNGEINRLGGMPIVAIPDSYLPYNVDFMVKARGVSDDPRVLSELRSNSQATGYFGTVMEGLYRYDAFVKSTKANGIYLFASSMSDIAASPAISISGTSCTITQANADAIYFTLDGTNPKNSSSRQTYSNAVTVSAGTIVRAYAVETSKLDSAIAEEVAS